MLIAAAPEGQYSLLRFPISTSSFKRRNLRRWHKSVAKPQ